jgi:hypothetical protein
MVTGYLKYGCLGQNFPGQGYQSLNSPHRGSHLSRICPPLAQSHLQQSLLQQSFVV